MKSEVQIIFKRKELQNILDEIKQYEYSKNEQERIEHDIDLLNWVLRDDIQPNKLIRNEK